MRYTKIILLATVVLVLSAGVVVGRLSARLPVAMQPDGKQPSWFANELSLTAQQRQQMDAIWADTRTKVAAQGDRRHALDKDRDQAINALLNESQRVAYEKIFEDYRQKRSELEKERDRLIHDAEDRSRALLDDQQKKRWDDLQDAHQKEMRERHAQHGPTTQKSTTRPAGAGGEGARP